MVDRRIEKKLRYIQGQIIANDEDDANWSQSKILNILLLLALLTSGNNIEDISFLKPFIKAFLNGKKIEIDDRAIDQLVSKLLELFSDL